MTVRSLTIDEYKKRVGSEIGVSEWILVDQPRVDQFADVTMDHQFIHVDPAKAAHTPLGVTVAHGYLTLSLLSAMAYDIVPQAAGAKMSLNYGFNKIRFLAPVKTGRRIRGRFHLQDFTERSKGEWMLTLAVTVEIEGEDKPALVAEWLSVTYV